jgi:hypothetical protein
VVVRITECSLGWSQLRVISHRHFQAHMHTRTTCTRTNMHTGTLLGGMVSSDVACLRELLGRSHDSNMGSESCLLLSPRHSNLHGSHHFDLPPPLLNTLRVLRDSHSLKHTGCPAKDEIDNGTTADCDSDTTQEFPVAVECEELMEELNALPDNGAPFSISPEY